VLSVPMEVINEAALHLVDRCLTDATGTRPDAHRSRGGRTRTSTAPNEDACKTTGLAIISLNPEPSEGISRFFATRNSPNSDF
jgi:hypothetical protein